MNTKLINKCKLGKIFLWLLLLFVMIPLEARETTITLCENGSTEYVIVIPDNATLQEQHAADELAYYLKKATTATFPIKPYAQRPSSKAIYIGACPNTTEILLTAPIRNFIGAEGFIVRLSWGRIYLAGVGSNTALYAVTDFLEKDINCTWFNEHNEDYIAQNTNITLDETLSRDVPSSPFDFRYFTQHRSYFKVDNEAALALLARNRISTFSNGHNKYGIPKYKLTDYTCHTSFKWIPPADYFETYPEYFSLHNGVRVNNRQLCFSNTGLRALLTQKILAAAETFGTKGVFSISAMDIPGKLCECTNCQALVNQYGCEGGALYDYLFELAPIMQTEHPTCYISTMAYREGQTEEPPTNNVNFPDNVIIMFIPLSSNFGQPFTHSSNDRVRNNLINWNAIVKNIWVWYYIKPYNKNFLPIGNLRKMAADFKFFRNNGVTGFINEFDIGYYNSHLLSDITGYIMMKLMWNPYEDLDTLITRASWQYYGTGSIKTYVDLLENKTVAASLNISWIPSGTEYTHLTPTFLVEAQNIFNNAINDVSNYQPLLNRVKTARLSLDRACLVFYDTCGASLGISKEDLADRYIEQYESVMKTRVDDTVSYYAAWRYNLNAFIHQYIEDPPQLPAEFDGKETHQIYPDDLSFTFGTGCSLIDDSTAAIDSAALYLITQVPFKLGYYDALEPKNIASQIPLSEIVVSEYHHYKMATVKITQNCYVWFGQWQLQVKLNDYYDTEAPNRVWDIYAMIRFEGASYGDSGADEVYIDRVFIVADPN